MCAEFRKYVRAGFGTLQFGVHVEDPEALLHTKGYDVVIIASGRHALTDEWRVPRDFGVTERDVQSALVLAFKVRTERPRPCV